jgi:hypothetical protein
VPDDEEAFRDATEQLYDGHPGDFVAARNDLVRALRKAGDRETAARVAELRRPSPAAWAVNRLARRRRADVEGLVGLGRALREAQDQALEGADAQLLRNAGRARRDAVAGLADVALGYLAETAAGAASHAGEVAATLEAASLDPQAGEAVLAGRLTAGLEPPSGFGDSPGGPTPTTARQRPRRAVPQDDDDARGAGAEPAEAEEAARAARAAAAQEALEEATRLSARLSAAAEAAAGRVADQEGAAREADAEVSRLERELEAARRSAGEAAHTLDEARSAAAAADAAAADARQRISDAEARVAALRTPG